MGFLQSVAKSLGHAKSATRDAAGSLFDAITGRNDAPAPPSQAAGADAGGAMSKTKPAGSPVAPCPVKAAAAAPGILSTAAQDRAKAKYARLSASDKSLFSDTVNNAGSDRERAYIWKAFAACHSPRECATFAARIRGRSPEWMQDKLSLTGSSQGTGVQQQWSHSCNATTVQAVRGQMDPIYALDTHDANPKMGKVDATDATKENPKLAEEQRRMLTSTYHGAAAGDHAGVAVGRGQAGGGGRWADDLFNQHSDETGVRYRTKKAPTDPATDIDAGLKTGAPVPIVIGNGPGQFTHYVLVTGSDAGPPKTYTIHDPWAGVTVSRSEADVKNGRLDLAGSNTVTAVEVPTPIAKPARRAPC